jgi:hypothetical protein
MKNKFALIFTIILIIASTLAVAAPALAGANGSCVENPQHGWHIVGGGQQNDHWFETEAECLAALNPATETASPTEETPVVTESPTDVPTDIPTNEPTETPVVTETPLPTDIPSATPLPTDIPSATPTSPPVVTGTPSAPGNSGNNRMDCASAWAKIVNLVHRDVGYRFFDNPNHEWCQAWLLNTYGIDYDWYKINNP